MRFNNERAIFLQIADHLQSEILAGRLAPGARLPSARELAVSLEVNPNTAARALQALAEAGVAQSERGLGYFVATEGQANARTERRRRFFEEELPRFLDALDELGVGLEEIARCREERGSRPPATTLPPAQEPPA